MLKTLLPLIVYLSFIILLIIVNLSFIFSYTTINDLLDIDEIKELSILDSNYILEST